MTSLGRKADRGCCTCAAFGKLPEELAAALRSNDGAESAYRGFGATIIDGSQPITDVAAAILGAARITSAPDL